MKHRTVNEKRCKWLQDVTNSTATLAMGCQFRSRLKSRESATAHPGEVSTKQTSC